MYKNQNRMPIVDSIQNYIAENCIRLHMPAHKGKPFFRNFPDYWESDLTEIAGLDDLHHPTGAIKEAQRLLSELFNTEKSFFLINGASGGIHAAILAQTKPGDKVIAPRHSHRSLNSALILSGASPVYIDSEICHNYGMPLGVNWESFRKKIREDKNIKLVFLQNPTYEGVAENFSLIKELLPENKALVVDEAHGGHFYFHPDFPASALTIGSGTVIHGAHKTLGSLTQTAYLHLNAGVEIKKIEETLALLMSTSPSYVLMASLDGARRKLALKGQEIYEKIISKAYTLKRNISKICGLYCLEEKELPDRKLDPTKIVISAQGLQLNGFQIEKLLRTDYGIQMEMASLKYVVGMLTLGDEQLDEDEIIRACKDLAAKYKGAKPKDDNEGLKLPQAPPVVLSPREAYFASKIKVPIRKSLGEISGETICPYPPGIPIICAGEKITTEIMEYLLWLKKSNVPRQGGLYLEEGKILISI